jgi:hypothetical protein
MYRGKLRWVQSYLEWGGFYQLFELAMWLECQTISSQNFRSASKMWWKVMKYIFDSLFLLVFMQIVIYISICQGADELSGRIAASHWQLWWIWWSDTFWVNLSQGYDCIHSCWVCFDLVRTGTFFVWFPYMFFLEFFSAFTWMFVSPVLTPYTFESTSGQAQYVSGDCCTPSQPFCSEVHYLSLSFVLLYFMPDCTFMSFASKCQYLFLLAISW